MNISSLLHTNMALKSKIMLNEDYVYQLALIFSIKYVKTTFLKIIVQFSEKFFTETIFWCKNRIPRTKKWYYRCQTSVDHPCISWAAPPPRQV